MVWYDSRLAYSHRKRADMRWLMVDAAARDLICGHLIWAYGGDTSSAVREGCAVLR